MTGLLNLYFLKHLVIALGFITFALTGAIWMTQALRLLDIVVEDGAPLLVFFQVALMTLPTFIGLILPICLVVAVVFVYNRLTTDSELVVVRAAGISPLGISRPAIQLALVTTVIAFLLSNWLTPLGHRELVKMEKTAGAEYASVFLKEGVFSEVTEGVTVYVRSRTITGELHGLIVHDSRKGQNITILAERGQLVRGENGTRVIVYNGNRQEPTDIPGQINQLYFDKYTIDISAIRPDLAHRWAKPRERRTQDLVVNPDNARDVAKASTLTAELHMRFATPFLGLSMVLVALASLFTGDFNRRGQNRRILLAAIWVLVLQGISLGSINLSAQNNAFVPLMYLTNIAPAAIGMLLLWRQGLPQKRKTEETAS